MEFGHQPTGMESFLVSSITQSGSIALALLFAADGAVSLTASKATRTFFTRSSSSKDTCLGSLCINKFLVFVFHFNSITSVSRTAALILSAWFWFEDHGTRSVNMPVSTVELSVSWMATSQSLYCTLPMGLMQLIDQRSWKKWGNLLFEFRFASVLVIITFVCHSYPLRLVRDKADWLEIHGDTPLCNIPGFTPWRSLPRAWFTAFVWLGP